jgi:[methyl-Co(III) methanol-specific corrinoid protein]:coenzyme M methyltransferase
MSAKRRFLAAMLGGPVDRTPVGNAVSIATVELMEACGAWFPDAHLDAALMAQLAATGHEILGYDTVMPVFSVVQEAAALGCEVDWGNPRMMPGVKTHPFATSESMRLPGGWSAAASIHVVLDAIHLLRAALGERVVIVGKVMGPWSLSYHMMGVEDFLIRTKLEPDRARRSVDVLKEVPVAFARAQMRAGADVICLADHATGGMVSPTMYRDWLMPVHQEIVEAIGCPTILHCCGNTTDRLGYFAETGIDCYHFESQVKIEDAVAAAKGKMTLMGSINNPTVLLGGTPEMVADASRQVIAGGVQILSPECAVPLFTPTSNLRVLVDVAEQLRPSSRR